MKSVVILPSGNAVASDLVESVELVCQVGEWYVEIVKASGAVLYETVDNDESRDEAAALRGAIVEAWKEAMFPSDLSGRLADLEDEGLATLVADLEESIHEGGGSMKAVDR